MTMIVDIKLIKDKIMCALLAERISQDLKWGELDHSPIFWLAILGEEFGESCQAAINLQSNYPTVENVEHYRTELIQTMALCMAMLECSFRNGHGEV